MNIHEPWWNITQMCFLVWSIYNWIKLELLFYYFLSVFFSSKWKVSILIWFFEPFVVKSESVYTPCGARRSSSWLLSWHWLGPSACSPERPELSGDALSQSPKLKLSGFVPVTKPDKILLKSADCHPALPQAVSSASQEETCLLLIKCRSKYF